MINFIQFKIRYNVRSETDPTSDPNSDLTIDLTSQSWNSYLFPVFPGTSWLSARKQCKRKENFLQEIVQAVDTFNIIKDIRF